MTPMNIIFKGNYSITGKDVKNPNLNGITCTDPFRQKTYTFCLRSF